METPLICNNIEFSYKKKKTLEEVSLSFQSGSLTAIIGNNGSGKTTLLQLLLGILKPNTGEIILTGKSLRKLSRRNIAKKIAFVPQETFINTDFSVKDIVAMGRLPHIGHWQTLEHNCQNKIDCALEKMGLLDLDNKPINNLSGGELQRVFIARALAQETKILVFDEPTANLDIYYQFELLSMLKQLASIGHIIIVAIHDLSLAARFCQRLLLLFKGRIVADGKPKQVLSKDNLLQYFKISTL